MSNNQYIKNINRKYFFNLQNNLVNPSRKININKIFSFIWQIIKKMQFILYIYLFFVYYKLSVFFKYYSNWFERKEWIDKRHLNWEKRKHFRWSDVFNPMFEIRYMWRIYSINNILRNHNVSNVTFLYASNVHKLVYSSTDSSITLYLSPTRGLMSILLGDEKINRDLILQTKHALSQLIRNDKNFTSLIINQFNKSFAPEVDKSQILINFIILPHYNGMLFIILGNILIKAVIFILLFILVFLFSLIINDSVKRKLNQIFSIFNGVFGMIGSNILLISIFLLIPQRKVVKFFANLIPILFLITSMHLLINKSLNEKMNQFIEINFNNKSLKKIYKTRFLISQMLKRQTMLMDITRFELFKINLIFLISTASRNWMSNIRQNQLYQFIVSYNNPEKELFFIIVYAIIHLIIFLVLHNVIKLFIYILTSRRYQIKIASKNIVSRYFNSKL